jgi:hypothetical protein
MENSTNWMTVIIYWKYSKARVSRRILGKCSIVYHEALGIQVCQIYLCLVFIDLFISTVSTAKVIASNEE